MKYLFNTFYRNRGVREDTGVEVDMRIGFFVSIANFYDLMMCADHQITKEDMC